MPNTTTLRQRLWRLGSAAQVGDEAFVNPARLCSSAPRQHRPAPRAIAAPAVRHIQGLRSALDVLKLIPPGSPVLQPIGARYTWYWSNKSANRSHRSAGAVCAAHRPFPKRCRLAKAGFVSKLGSRRISQLSAALSSGEDFGVVCAPAPRDTPATESEPATVQRRGNTAAAVVRVFGQRQFKPLAIPLLLHQHHIFQRRQRCIQLTAIRAGRPGGCHE